jgi:predicted Zn finger-like uncharacterized protein
MKITCQSCHSKYNVADEKVQGKVAKIRCRKCGATMVVDGTGAAAANGGSPPSAPAVDSPAGAASSNAVGAPDISQWHVNVAEGDQRTMTLAEVVDAYHTGTVTQDTYIWTDGMDDWKALGEVEAILAALHGTEQAPPPPPPSATPNGLGGDAAPSHPTSREEPDRLRSHKDDGGEGATRIFRGQGEPGTAAPSAVADPADPMPAVAARPEAKRAAVVRRETRARDLFASRADDGLGALDVETSAPTLAEASNGSAVDDATNKRTGERNENSVLFSLAVLTQNADQRAPSATSAMSSDDSGLIDLKALAAKTESMRPQARDASGHVPPLGAIPPISAPFGAFESPLSDANEKSRLPLFIGMSAVGLLVIVAVLVIGVRVGANSAAGAAVSAGPTAAASAPAASAEAERETTPSAPPTFDAIAAQAASAAPSSAAMGFGKPHVTGGGSGGGVRPQTAKATAPGPNAAAEPAPAPASPSPPPAKKTGDCGCNGDLMCLMKCSTH